MAITSAGLGSGLDIEGIITKLMAIEAQPLTKLTQKEVSYQAKLTAYGTFKSQVSSFRGAASALNNSSAAGTLKATTSDEASMTASASSIATTGSYTVEVTQLAKAQQLVASGQSSLTSSLGTGTISFDFGTIAGGVFNPTTGQYTGSTFTSNGSGVKTVTISAANDSLTGIRDAVNAANIGVTATIINDGSATPYRLAFSVANQGVSNSLKISVAGAPSLDGLISNDPAGTQNLQETVTAQDALLKINGLSITQSSNTVTSAITGVTLNLLKTNAGSPATISVAKDTSKLGNLVSDYVESYNELQVLIKELTKYDPENPENNGLLLGDTAVRSVQSQIRSAMLGRVPGLNGAYSSFSQVGVTFNRDGTLAFDSSKLNAAITADPDAVTALFATIGRPTDSLIKYVSSTSSTQVGRRQMDVTALATQGVATGVAPVASLTISNGVNDTLNLTVDGNAVAVTIPAGVYATQAALNSAIQSAINGAASGSSVAVTDVAGLLSITSNRYGLTSSVGVGGGTAALNLFGAASIAGGSGTDVAATINGTVVNGEGQYITTADGLKIQITGGALGNRGFVDFSRGFGYLLDQLTLGFLGDDGTIDSRIDGVNNSIDRIDTNRETINKRLELVEKRYRAQFSALDVLLSSLSETSNFLTQQLASLTGNNKK